MMNNNLSQYAPIVVFCFNRPAHLKALVQSLLNCPESKRSRLIIYCDGPRNAQEEGTTFHVRKYAESVTGFLSLNIICRDNNLGLSRSIISGVTEQLNVYSRAIILEDDLIVSPHFLKFMNDGLDLYQFDEKVASIHGYMYPVDAHLPSTFFLRGADCWGWATWSNRWSTFEKDGSNLLKELISKNLIFDFDLGGSYHYSKMLHHQIIGRNDSWAVRWHASCFLKGLLTLYPNVSLIYNAGNDNSGTNTGINSDYNVSLARESICIRRQALFESKLAKEAVIAFFWRKKKFSNRLKRYIRNRKIFSIIWKFV